jgi:ABC-type transport system involved in cytochrome bd biosynthesis fused ATPase/permease subunit
LAALAILVQPLRDLAGVWDYRCAWVIARDKLETLLATPTLKPADTGSKRGSTGPVHIAFKKVYREPLRGFEASAEPGQKVAIIGPNGAGKSTCLAVAAGLEPVDRGGVQFDGIDLAHLPHPQRRRTIAFVGPRSPILQGSLRRALTLGVKPRPADAAIERAARAYGLGDVLDRLGGLGGRVAEAGRSLSSGEARRVHLVRAFLANPGLLLLDEPDDVLDADGAQALRRLLQDSSATSLIVTRDASLARSADIVWYIETGQLLAVGTPDELIEHDGHVARSFRQRHVA